MKRLAVISICLVLLIGGLGYFINSQTQLAKENARTYSPESKDSKTTGSFTTRIIKMDQSTEAVVRNFEEMIAHDDPPIFSEPAEVLDHLSGDLKEGFMYPDQAQLQQLDPTAGAVIKNLIGIYIMPVVERDDPNYGKVPPEIHIYFNDGSKNFSPTSFDPRETLLIMMRINQDKLDPYQSVERHNRERRDGYSDADVDTKVIDINGIKGYARPPGYKGFGNNRTPRAGFVIWQQGNVVYDIKGLDSEPGTQLHTLAAIARSMKPLKKD